MQPLPDHVERPVRPARVGETAGSGDALIDRAWPPVAGRHEPCPGIGRGRRAAGAEIAFIDKDHPRPGLSRGKRRPGAGRSTADNQHIGHLLHAFGATAVGHPRHPRWTEGG